MKFIILKLKRNEIYYYNFTRLITMVEMEDIRGVQLRKFNLRKIILGVRMHFHHTIRSFIIIIIIIKNECHSNVIVDRLQGCYDLYESVVASERGIQPKKTPSRKFLTSPCLHPQMVECTMLIGTFFRQQSE